MAATSKLIARGAAALAAAAVVPLTGGWRTGVSPAVTVPGADVLHAVAAASAGDAWAVGSRYLNLHNGTFLTLTEHWNGTKWSVVPSPSPEGTTKAEAASILAGVAVISPSNAWAVGDRFARNSAERALVEHWNGTKWSVVPSRGLGRCALGEVSAASPSDIWAVGIDTAGGGSVIAHWNGSAWRRVPSPMSARTSLNDVTAISPRDVWAVGTVTVTGGNRTLIEHWNGVKWTRVPSPNAFAGRSRHSTLAAVSGSSRSSVWAVGNFRSGRTSLDKSTFIVRWNGTRWQRQASPNIGRGGDNSLTGISALSRRDAWAVGAAFVNHRLRMLIQHWDGTRWQIVPSPAPPTASYASLEGVAAVSPSVAWAVGGIIPRSGLPRTLIEQWNGTSWQPVRSPSP